MPVLSVHAVYLDSFQSPVIQMRTKGLNRTFGDQIYVELNGTSDIPDNIWETDHSFSAYVHWILFIRSLNSCTAFPWALIPLLWAAYKRLKHLEVKV